MENQINTSPAAAPTESAAQSEPAGADTEKAEPVPSATGTLTPPAGDPTARGRAVMRRHLANAVRMGQALCRAFPNVDVEATLADRRFLIMTSPMVGLSPEDAYFALNRHALQTYAMRYAAQKSAEGLSDAILSGSLRPTENGTSGVCAAPTPPSGPMTPAQRAALKAEIRHAAAMGKKIFPK